MAWLRLSDNLDSDPAVLNICRRQSEVTQVVGLLTRLMLASARHLTDGFIPEITFNDIVRSRRWRERFVAPPNGGTALVHRRGDVCACLKDRDWPDTAADFCLHLYLANNPSREEYDVQRAKAAELRDSELRAAVRRRDRDRCRYCGVPVRWADRKSSVGGVLDHVDPRCAAGAANLVVSCRGCNSRKGNRTPAAAGMTLLPVPGTRMDGDPDPINGSITDPTTHAPVRDGTGLPDLAAGDAGLAGDRPLVGPPDTPRSSHHPNVYHRSAITGLAPDDHAGLPGPDAFLSIHSDEREDDP